MASVSGLGVLVGSVDVFSEEPEPTGAAASSARERASSRVQRHAWRPGFNQLGGLLLLGLTACGERLPPLEFSSDRVRIGTTTDRPCQGDLDWLDARVEFIERKLGVSGPSKLELYLFNSRDELPCRSEVSGCYFNEVGKIAAIWPAVGHELVHSVTRDVDYASTFWSEGIAEAYSGDGSVRWDERPLSAEQLAENDAMKVSYNNAGHLVRFIEREWGDEAVLSVATGSSMSDVLGGSVSEVLEQHRTDAAFSVRGRSLCDFPELAEVEPGRWEFENSFSCSDPGVTQFQWDGVAVLRTVALPESGRYSVVVDGGAGVRIIGCQLDDLEEEPEFPSNGDLPNQADAIQSAIARFFESGETHELELTAGVYRLAMVGPDGGGAASMRATVRRIEP